MNPDEILAVLRATAAGKMRAGGFDALNEMLRRHSHFTAQDGRREFVAGLQVLVARGAVRLPAPGPNWDRLGQVPLPKWIQIAATETPATDGWDHRTHPWHPRLAFLAELNRVTQPEEVKRLNSWLQQMPADELWVPVKERSWEILGDEKRLEAIAKTALFQPERLTWEALRCYVVEHIPPHRVYPQGKPVMMISENEAGFDSFCRYSEETGEFRCVVLGNGLALDKATAFLGKAIADYQLMSGFYFGDLDATGLAIASRVTRELRERFTFTVMPWLPGYTSMLADTLPVAGPVTGDCTWLPSPLGAQAASLLENGTRVAQESVGRKRLPALFRSSAS